MPTPRRVSLPIKAGSCAGEVIASIAFSSPASGARPCLLDGRLVHEAFVQIADAARVGIALVRGRVLDQRPQLVLDPVVDRHERSQVGLVGRERRVLQPGAVDISEEVVLGPHRRIAAAAIDAGGRLGRLVPPRRPRPVRPRKEGRRLPEAFVSFVSFSSPHPTLFDGPTLRYRTGAALYVVQGRPDRRRDALRETGYDRRPPCRFPATPHAGAPGHQSETRFSGGRYSASPGLTPKVA